MYHWDCWLLGLKDCILDAGGTVKRSNRKFFALAFFILVFVLGYVSPVLADYLGPDRTVTVTTTKCEVVLLSSSGWRLKVSGSTSNRTPGPALTRASPGSNTPVPQKRVIRVITVTTTGNETIQTPPAPLHTRLLRSAVPCRVVSCIMDGAIPTRLLP